MANVQEMQMMELKKELDVLNVQLSESREANAKLRRRVEDLKIRNEQLERCIVKMALERCEGEH